MESRDFETSREKTVGKSIETRVRVIEFSKTLYREAAELKFIRYAAYPNEEDSSYVTPKAAKALKGVQPGDVVEVVWDYDVEGGRYGVYPIVKARRITGSLELRVEAMEKTLRDAGFKIVPLDEGF